MARSIICAQIALLCMLAGAAATQPDAGWSCRDRRPVWGDLGSASPLQAVEKPLVGYQFDEIIVATLPAASS
jgi:hypothetical protein